MLGLILNPIIRIVLLYENDKMPSYPSKNPHNAYHTQPLLNNFTIFIEELTSKYEIYIILYTHVSVPNGVGSNA